LVNAFPWVSLTRVTIHARQTSFVTYGYGEGRCFFRPREKFFPNGLVAIACDARAARRQLRTDAENPAVSLVRVDDSSMSSSRKRRKGFGEVRKR
jgi:hypothetical protein